MKKRGSVPRRRESRKAACRAACSKSPATRGHGSPAAGADHQIADAEQPDQQAGQLQRHDRVGPRDVGDLARFVIENEHHHTDREIIRRRPNATGLPSRARGVGTAIVTGGTNFGCCHGWYVRPHRQVQGADAARAQPISRASPIRGPQFFRPAGRGGPLRIRFSTRCRSSDRSIFRLTYRPTGRGR